MSTPPDILDYESVLTPEDQAVCAKIRAEIERTLPEATGKVWHAHPVWFLDGNPVFGYSRLKGGVQLLFWSGRTFDETGLKNEGKFEAAEKRYTDTSEVDTIELARWLSKSRDIQWDYANIVKRQGKLERLK